MMQGQLLDLIRRNKSISLCVPNTYVPYDQVLLAVRNFKEIVHWSILEQYQLKVKSESWQQMD